mgnify:CR=1 FL=1
MPANKNKRKAPTHSGSKKRQLKPGLLSTYPKESFWVGVACVIVGLYIALFGSSSSVNSGLAMLLIFSGAIAAFIAKISEPNK